MPLNSTPISRNLKTSIRMLGLDIEDLMALGIIAVGALIIGQFVFPKGMSVFSLPMNWFCFFAVLVIGIPGLLLFKYGKPRGYLKDFISWHLRPRHWSPFGRDSVVTGPYLIEENDELPGREKKGGKLRV